YSIVVRDFLDEYIEFPQLIEVDKFSDQNDIEKITLKLREIMNLHDDPIEDMIEVVELMGIIAVKFGYDEEKVDAFSALTELNNKSYFTIVTGNSRSFFRQQFSLAHEIGHWVLHQDYIPEELDKEEYKVMEQEANAFAASFLMPSQSFSEDFKSINLNLPNLLNLKRKWNVSIAAIIERAHQLNLLSIDKKSQLYRKMNYHKWRNPEPLDSDTPVTEPLALSQAIELLIDENILTGYEIKKHIMEKYNLYISQKMLAEVCNTSESIFNHRNKLELNIKMKKFTKNIDEYN
ncbi:ImmA/IrrE family metallo-endopeptidase, partial [Mammaliicoccus sciuri]|uniref:ImmA/IrrE family metallo-endopeptidase n=2 Tax=Staphylococcaceae TaxID=90964 RepID=UPI000D1E5B25